MTKEDRVRIAWIDQARGIGIFLVVLGHTLRGLEAGGIVGDGPAFRLVDAWIYRFHMPLFFLLAGLFAGRRVDRGPWAFLLDKLATLAYPYLIWSALQTLLQIATSRYANHPPGPADLPWILVVPVMQFWFLYALFLIGLIYYALRRAGLGPVGTLAAFSSLWAARCWAPRSGWWPLDAATGYGIYYALGSALDHRGWTGRLGAAPAIGAASAAILGYGIVTLSVALRPPGGPPALDLAVALSGIAASIALAVLLGRAAVADFVRVVGSYSLEIYVAHTIASAGIRIALQKILKVEDPAAHILLGTAGGIVLPLALAWISRRHHAGFLFRYPRRREAR